VLCAILWPPTAPLNPLNNVYVPLTVTLNVVLMSCWVLVKPLHVVIELTPVKVDWDPLLELPPWFGASTPAAHAAYALL
jgi:hypothetical protein